MKQQKSKLQTSKKQISKQLKKLKPKKNNVAFYLSVILVIFIIVAFVYMYIEKREPEVTETPTTPDETPTEDITTLPPEDDPDDDSKETSEKSPNTYLILCSVFLSVCGLITLITIYTPKKTSFIRKVRLIKTNVNTNNENTKYQPILQLEDRGNSAKHVTEQDDELELDNEKIGLVATIFKPSDGIINHQRKLLGRSLIISIYVTYIVLSFLREQLDPSKQTSDEMVITFQVTSIVMLVGYIMCTFLRK